MQATAFDTSNVCPSSLFKITFKLASRGAAIYNGRDGKSNKTIQNYKLTCRPQNSAESAASALPA